MSKNFSGCFSPLKLAEVETIALEKFKINFLQNKSFTTRIAADLSSAKRSFAKFLTYG